MIRPRKLLAAAPFAFALAACHPKAAPTARPAPRAEIVPAPVTAAAVAPPATPEVTTVAMPAASPTAPATPPAADEVAMPRCGADGRPLPGNVRKGPAPSCE